MLRRTQVCAVRWWLGLVGGRSRRCPRLLVGCLPCAIWVPFDGGCLLGAAVGCHHCCFGPLLSITFVPLGYQVLKPALYSSVYPWPPFLRSSSDISGISVYSACCGARWYAPRRLRPRSQCWKERIARHSRIIGLVGLLVYLKTYFLIQVRPTSSPTRELPCPESPKTCTYTLSRRASPAPAGPPGRGPQWD